MPFFLSLSKKNIYVEKEKKREREKKQGFFFIDV